MTNSSESLPSAPVIRRIAAIIYDSLLVFAVLCAATLPVILYSSNTPPEISNGDVVHDVHPMISDWPFQIYLLVIITGFFCWFWRRNGQTLGMQAWRLQVEDMDGDRISLLQCLQRLAGATLSLLCLGIGYWWAWIDKEGLCWHDRWSKTRVILLPKK